jgi:hypothetical protein
MGYRIFYIRPFDAIVEQRAREFGGMKGARMDGSIGRG